MKNIILFLITMTLASCHKENVQINETENKIGFRFNQTSDVFLQEGKDSVISYTISADASIYNNESLFLEISESHKGNCVPVELILDDYIESLYMSKPLFDIVNINVDGKNRQFLKYNLHYFNDTARINFNPNYSDYYWGDNTFSIKIYNHHKDSSNEGLLYFDSLAENQMITVHYKEKTEQPVVGIVDRSHRHEFLVFDLTLEQDLYTKIYDIYTPTKSFHPIEVSLAYESKLIKDEHFSVEVEYSDNDSLAALQGSEQKVWVTFKIADKEKVKNGDRIKFKISRVENGLIANATDGLINELTLTIKK